MKNTVYTVITVLLLLATAQFAAVGVETETVITNETDVTAYVTWTRWQSRAWKVTLGRLAVYPGATTTLHSYDHRMEGRSWVSFRITDADDREIFALPKTDLPSESHLYHPSDNHQIQQFYRSGKSTRGNTFTAGTPYGYTEKQRKGAVRRIVGWDKTTNSFSRKKLQTDDEWRAEVKLGTFLAYKPPSTRIIEPPPEENRYSRYEKPIRLTLKRKDGIVLIKGLSIPYGQSLPNKGGNAFIPLQQPTDETCGPTSLEMVLHYYGKWVTMGEIFDKGGIHTVYFGTTPSEMKQALNKLGVPARYHDEDTSGYSSFPLAHLRTYVSQNRPPCILIRVPEGYHWVVVVGYNTKTNEFLLADPGPRNPDGSGEFWWVSQDNLKNAWNFERDLEGGRTSFSRGFNYGFDLDWIDLATLAVDPYTAIVPDDAPTREFPGMWSEMKSFRMTGTGRVFGITRGWEKTIEFNNKFDLYKATSIEDLLSTGDAELNGHDPVGTKSVNLWGRIEDGLTFRGKMHVIVRTYRTEESPAAPAQTVSTRLSASPAETSLLPNYPNPFNPETWIPYQLAKPAEVNVSIYSADGKLVRTLELGQMPAGAYADKDRAAYWDGQNEQGEPVASGVYFYTLTAGEFSATRKMVIRK